MLSASRIVLRTYTTGQSYGEYVRHSASNSRFIWGLIIANTIVFAGWEYCKFGQGSDQLKAFMYSNFVISGDHIKANRYWTIVTSAFSHISEGHFLGNMITLYAFGSLLATFPGMRVANLAVLSFGSAVSGSLGWLLHERRDEQAYVQRHAVGASGMIMGLGAAAACLTPTTTFLLFGIVPMPLWMLVGGYFLYDSYYLDSKDSRVGHAGHLGGLAFGVAYYALRLRRLGGIFRLR
ncbi:hypothetical protein NA57DRAFT_75495 [Rhizodiscina lignyota]|uniref:Peptidase S54 rhomboid domain-containing protein n=1 Tax=Rhizodiscina lignyota TaxID=1504668 RepID=A0A9P4IHA7_9PEZI|nr:hypothetical protein NA57DRAFT_75495 [Rhizodiscina lignyota]